MKTQSQAAAAAAAPVSVTLSQLKRRQTAQLSLLTVTVAQPYPGHKRNKLYMGSCILGEEAKRSHDKHLTEKWLAVHGEPWEVPASCGV